MKKSDIVQRLLDNNQITAEEAILLLKESSNTVQGFVDLGSKPILEESKVPYHKICGCNVCNCTIGNTLVYPWSSGNFNTSTTISND